MSDQRWAKQAASALFGVASRARRSETRADIASHGDREDAEREEVPGTGADADAYADAIGPGSTDPPLPAGALRAGETVAFLSDGLPYVADRAPTGEAVGFALSALEVGASVADPATHLVVVRQGAFLGFRSELPRCDGKLLQARHRGRGRLCFFNRNHGVNEQWETPDEPDEPGWTAATLRLRNRRLPSCVLRVTVTRVPPEMRVGASPQAHTSAVSPAAPAKATSLRAASGKGRGSPASPTFSRGDDARASGGGEALARDADRGSGSDSDSDSDTVSRPVARKVAFHEDEIGRAAAAAAAAEVQRAPYVPTPSGGAARGAAGEEQTHALRSMSGVLIKEWSAFVLKEVRARKEVERQMLELREEMLAMVEGFREETSAARKAWNEDVSFYGATARDARLATAAQRRKVVRMVRATYSRRWTGDAFARWRVAAFQKRRRRVAVRRAAARLTSARLAKALAAWRARAVARRVARRAIARSIHVGDRGATRRAFGAWKRATLADADAKRHDRLIAALQRRAAGKMRLASASRAVAGWRERTRERRRLRGILRKTHARWTRSTCANAFYAWRSFAVGKRARRERVSRLVLRVLDRERRAAFLAWASRARTRRRFGRVAAALRSRFDRSATRSCFRLWRRFVETRTSRETRVVQLARRIAARWNGVAKAKALERWRFVCARRARARRRAAGVVKKWRRRDLHAAFAEWATTVMYVLAARDNALLFAVRITRLASHKAFRTWRDAASDLKNRRAKVTAVVERWRRAETAAAFEGWAVAAARSKAQTKRARALVWRVTHASVARAFRAWAHNANRSARQRADARAVLAPMLQRALAAAFRGWRFRTRDLSRRAALARRVVRRMGALRLASAFRTWRDAADDALESRAVVSGALRKMANVKLFRAWSAWAAFAATRRREKVALSRATRFAARRAGDRAETVWRAWFTETRACVSYRKRAARAVSRIRASVAARAFDTWLDAARERARHDALVARGRRRFNRFALRDAIVTWWRLTEARVRARAVAARAARKLERLRARVLFEAWRLSALRSGDLSSRAKMRRAARAWTRQTLGSAWRSWKASVDLDRVRRASAARHFAVKTAVRVERSKRRAFLGWTAYAAYYKRTSLLVAKAYAKSRRIYARSVFDQWAAFCEEVETRKETLKRCVTSKRLLTSWFLDWYWQAFEGDIAGALGLITDSTETVIGSVYGETRATDASALRQWQSLGSSLEAMTAGADPRSPARAAARKLREQTREVMSEGRGATRGSDASDDDASSFATPGEERRGLSGKAPDASFAAGGDENDDDGAFGRAGGSARATPVRASPSVSRRRLSLSDDGGDSEDEIDRRVLSEFGARR